MAAGALFGIAEGTVRVALSRMVSAGELLAVDGGYELTGPLRERFARQEQSRVPIEVDWGGRWVEAVVVGERRSPSQRAALRRATRALRLGGMREGVWLRPDNLDPDRLADSRRIVDAQCLTFRLEPVADPATLAARLWDLSGWADSALRLQATLAGFTERLEAGDSSVLASAFVAAAAVVRHLLADPLLPVELVPDDWPGRELRADYERNNAVFSELWRVTLRPPAEP